jgi:hypothetical protein
VPAIIGNRQKSAERETADEAVSRQLAHYTGKPSLPPLILGFLGEHWRSYLKRVHALDGGEGERWRDAAQTMDQLIWSLLPKRNAESRQLLFAILPQLTQRLHAALQSMGLETAAEDLFFAELAKLHAAALNPAPPCAGGTEPDDTHDSGVQTDPAQTARPAGDDERDGAQVDGERVAPGQPNHTPRTGSANRDTLPFLPLGASMEFRDGRSTPRQLRLTWTSGSGGVFMFQDWHSGDLICLTASRLKKCVRGGSARILSR